MENSNCKNGIDFRNFPHCNKSAFEHKIRKDVQKLSGDSMFATTQKGLDNDILSCLSVFGNSSLINRARGMAAAGKFELAKGHTEPFGAVNTVEKSGCVAFVTYDLLVLCGLEYLISFSEVVKLAAENGFRVWHYKNSKNVLSMSSISLRAVLEAFADDPAVQACANLKDIEELLGEPVGIGGSMYFVDEFIGFIGKTEPYTTTRLYTIMSVLDSLSRGIPVPVRVNYGHMLNDPTKTEGHYVNLVGFEDNHAVIVDSSIPGFIYECPSRRFLESMIMDTDRGLTCAWNAAPLVNIDKH